MVEIASLLGDPGIVWVRRASDELEAACREGEEEEHIDPLQSERLDRKEIAGERARCLLAQERPPQLAPALGSRWDASARQDLAHRRR
jgi:hypothetical protein